MMTTLWDPDTPIYIQLYRQVIQRIIDGNIKENEPLPSVRTVSTEYRLNPITISKAYQLLQDDHLVEKQRGKGLFVVSGAQQKVLKRERDEFLHQEWPTVVEKINRLQFSVRELLADIEELQ